MRQRLDADRAALRDEQKAAAARVADLEKAAAAEEDKLDGLKRDVEAAAFRLRETESKCGERERRASHLLAEARRGAARGRFPFV